MDDFEWSVEMQERHGAEFDSQFWEDPDVTPIDSLNIKSENADPNSLAEKLDHGGADKLVVDADGCIYLVPQRIRRDDSNYRDSNEMYGVDFSLRWLNNSTYPAELEKMTKARENKWAVKHRLYAFGIADVDKADFGGDQLERIKDTALQRGFKYYAFYDIQGILDYYFENPSVGDQETNGDGTGGLFFKLREIEDYKVWYWQKDENNNPYNEESQSGLGDF